MTSPSLSQFTILADLNTGLHEGSYCVLTGSHRGELVHVSQQEWLQWEEETAAILRNIMYHHLLL